MGWEVGGEVLLAREREGMDGGWMGRGEGVTLTRRPRDWYSLRSGTMFSASTMVDTMSDTGVALSSPTWSRVSSVVWVGVSA